MPFFNIHTDTVLSQMRVVDMNFFDIDIIADLSHQAAKSLLYFFAEDKSAIYVVIAFSIFSPINTQPLRSQMTKLVGQGLFFN